jgi:ribbon-helix-helix protein, copG family
LKLKNRHRVNVYLSEEEYELLKKRQNESRKSQSEVLKESLYREQNIMDAKFSDSIFKIACWIDQKEYDKIREEVKKYADYQIRERK